MSNTNAGRRKLSIKSISSGCPAFVSVLLFLVICIVTVALQPKSVSMSWVGIKADATFTLVLAAIGQTLVLLIGGIDLSVAGIISLTNSISAVYMQDSIPGMLWVCLLSLLIGTLIGSLNGWIIVKTGIQPFIVTFASWYIWAGAALLVLPVDGGTVPERYVRGMLARFGGVSVSLILIILLGVLWVYFKNTNMGLTLFAVGSNDRAAHLNGLNVNRTKIMIYGASGFFAAAAGVFRTAQVASGSPTAGESFFMQAIAAAVIGGTALSGGKGGVIGTIFGAFVLKMIADILVFAQVSSYWSALFQGLLLIIAVAAGSIAEIVSRQKEVRL